MRDLFISLAVAMLPMFCFAQSTQNAAVCGNAIVESGEQCDDGNDLRFDGCWSCREDIKVTELPPQKMDPNKAFRVSIATTLFGPPGLGLIYGPSIGHFYAGKIGRGVASSAARALLIGGQVTLLSLLSSDKINDEFRESIPALLIVDGVLLSGLVYLDLLTGTRAVIRSGR